MKSREKLSVSVELVKTDDGNKPWAVIRFVRAGDREIIPSFEDLFQIIHSIVHCERKKYAGRVSRPSDMVRTFLHRMVDGADKLCDLHPEWPAPERAHDAVWLRLANEFRIPIRDDRATKAVLGPPTTTNSGCQPGCTCELCREWPMKRSA